ncbi:MAG TPA: ATP synthase F0 subunit B [Bryobacteraceae bacterium]|nr:ATP synthase F0 subunit B [Bryobacteraceae bacterium]
MRRATLALALGLALASCALPQENPSNPASGAGDPWMVWKWVNFAILAAGLGYLIGKTAPAYFRNRSEEIQKHLVEAAREIKDAEARAAGFELRLAGIQSEVENLRAEARAGMAAEGQRIRRETERRLEKIREQTSQEIALMARAAGDDLRKYLAVLALDMAEQRLRSRITPDSQSALLDGFLHELRYRAKPGVSAR